MNVVIQVVIFCYFLLLFLQFLAWDAFLLRLTHGSGWGDDAALGADFHCNTSSCCGNWLVNGDNRDLVSTTDPRCRCGTRLYPPVPHRKSIQDEAFERGQQWLLS